MPIFIGNGLVAGGEVWEEGIGRHEVQVARDVDDMLARCRVGWA